MPSQTQYDLATLSLKSLVLYLAFAAVVSKASPIPQSISTRGMGISSPSEDRMSLKVGNPAVAFVIVEDNFPNLVAGLERLRMAVRWCGRDNP